MVRKDASAFAAVTVLKRTSYRARFIDTLIANTQALLRWLQSARQQLPFELPIAGLMGTQTHQAATQMAAIDGHTRHAPGRDVSMSKEINVLAMVKGEERYIFLYDDEHRVETLRMLGRYAADPQLSFSGMMQPC